MMVIDNLHELKEYVRNQTPLYGTHGFEHVNRVYHTCLRIGLQEKVNMKILLTAALLHDIERDRKNHAFESAIKAGRILSKYEYSSDEINQIKNIISAHSFSGNKKPDSTESMILSDADKLDALGAIGVYRTAVYSGEHARSVEEFISHFNDKLFKLDGLLYTFEAKKIAKNRVQFMKEYIRQLETELNEEP